jgi:membrane-associated protein
MAFTEILMHMNRSSFAVWGHLIVFVALFLESLPFIGALIPGGTIVLLLAGILSKWGFFTLWQVALVAIAASISIDTFSYALGRSVNRDFFHKCAGKCFVKKSVLERVGRTVHGHTGKALIFGRLNPVTRSIGPFIVGNERVNFGKFFLFNVIGGILWVIMFLFVGYMFGAGLSGIEEMEHFVLWTTIIIVSCFYGYYVFNSLKGKNGKKSIKG